MKKNLFWTMAAAVALASCSDTELVENLQVQEQNAIAFSTYLGDNAQGRAVVMDKPLLGVEGFGVNAYYTKDQNYGSEDAKPETFMANTKVTLNKDKGTEGLWEYSPVKYWPNNEGDKVSFFAYGPHANGGKENNIELTGTDIKFTVNNEVKNQVDLIYNTNYDGTLNQEKPAVEDRIQFKFDHALARIAFTVEAAVDEITNGKHLLDGNTRINVKKVALVTEAYEEGEEAQAGPFYQEGTLSLLEPEEDESPWSNLSTDTQAFVFNATDHFRHTVKDVDAKEINKTDAAKIDVMQLTRYNASEPQQLLNDSSFLMIIPQTVDAFRIYIEYDVISEGYDNADDTSFDGSGITNKILSDEIKAMDFEKGKAYNFNLILGMTSVKFEADVTDWDDSTPSQDEWLPENTEAALRYNTQSSVFEIYNEKQLDQMRRLVNSGATYTVDAEGNVTTIESRATRSTEGTSYAEASYILMEDIDLSVYANWEPIGLTDDTPFKGIFDGNGKRITGLRIDKLVVETGNNNVGLFGNIDRAAISRLSVEGDISAPTVKNVSTRMGGIVAYSESSSITNCSFSGSLTTLDGDDEAYPQMNFIGGIVGHSYSTEIIACHNHATIQDLNDMLNSVCIGGIAGYVQVSTKIYGCYNYATSLISSACSGVGGIAGQVESKDIDIQACYSTTTNIPNANSEEHKYRGSILGSHGDSAPDFESLTSCYATQSTLAICGSKDLSASNGTVADGNWTNARDAMNNALIELYNEGANSQYNWKYVAAEGDAPLTLEAGVAEYVAPPMSGKGTADDPYLIYTAAQLKTAADKINEYCWEIPEGGEVYWPQASYKLMKDIDLSTICSEELGTWIPIDRLEGGFDGNNKTISNLYIYDGGKSGFSCGIGFFGDHKPDNGAKIENLNIEGDITATGTNFCIGGIVGRLNYNSKDDPATIENCTFKGSITIVPATDEYYTDAYPYAIGGIVGENADANIINCHTLSGSRIDGNQDTGGIVGRSCGNVIGCSNAAYVLGKTVGGIVGNIDIPENSMYIVGCHNTGKIESLQNYRYAAGILPDGTDAKVIGCYNSGNVSGGYANGGILGVGMYYTNPDEGKLSYGSIVIGNYNTGTITGNNATAIIQSSSDPYSPGRIISANYYADNTAQESFEGVSPFDASDYTSAMNAMNTAISTYEDDTEVTNPTYGKPVYLPLDVEKYINSWQYTTEGATAEMPLRLINSTLGIN